MNKAQKIKIENALKNAKNVYAHHGNLRIHFRLPKSNKVTKKSLSIPITLSNIELAISKLAQVKGDISNGTFENNPDKFWLKHFPTNISNRDSNITLADYFELYKKEKEHELTYSTYNKLKTCLNWVTQYNLHNLNVAEVNHRILNKLRKNSLTSRTASTVKEYSMTLRQVMYEALSDEKIESDPFLKVKKIKNSGLDIEDELVDPFSQKELAMLVEAIHIPQTKIMVQFLAWTGLRPGEMKALAWEDINFEKNQINVQYNLDRAGKLKPPKTMSGKRKVDMFPIVHELLEKQKERSVNLPTIIETVYYKNFVTKDVSRHRIFLSRDNKPYKRPELTTTGTHWQGWLKEAELKYRPPYQLRHTFASRMLMADANHVWLSKQMGHKDWGLIQKIYGKWIDDETPYYIDEIAKKLGQKKKNKIKV
jgi:integrase